MHVYVYWFANISQLYGLIDYTMAFLLVPSFFLFLLSFSLFSFSTFHSVTTWVSTEATISDAMSASGVPVCTVRIVWVLLGSTYL